MAELPYTVNVPLSNQRIDDTQENIQDNFEAIKDIFEVNHITFDDPGFGFHDFISLIDNLNNPISAVTSTELLIYNGNETRTEERQVYIRRSGRLDVPFTAQLSNTQKGDKIPGWSYLPSGLLLKYGNSGMGSTGTAQRITKTLIYNQGPPFTSFGLAAAPFRCILTASQRSAGLPLAHGTLGNDSVIISGQRATSFNYLIIGPAD